MIKNLKKLRLENNLTQEDLAKIINKSSVAYGYYEAGRNEPDIETLKKIADYFDVSLDFLCDRPRPYDLPSTATNNQKQAINIILQLNDVNSLRAISYCAGLLAGQN